MTAGTTQIGTQPSAYYRYRQWVGGDGSHGDEHNYSYNVTESSLKPIGHKPWASFPFWLEGSMQLLSPSIPQDPFDRTVNLVNCATAKAIAEIQGGNFHLGVFSGEFKESYHMITGAVHSIAKAINLAKRGRWTRAFRVLSLSPREDLAGVTANSWMLWHFGISPLLKDIEAALKFMTTHYRRLKYVRRHCVYKDNKILIYSNAGETSWDWSEKAIAEVRCAVDMVELSLADRLGVSYSDIPIVAWELTKLSWMIDWIIPIGTFLEAVNGSNKTEGSQIAVTRMQKERLCNPVYSGDLVKNFDPKAFRVHYGPGALNSRAILDSLPCVFPTIQNPLGDHLARWYTAAAFLRQAVGR